MLPVQCAHAAGFGSFHGLPCAWLVSNISGQLPASPAPAPIPPDFCSRFGELSLSTVFSSTLQDSFLATSPAHHPSNFSVTRGPWRRQRKRCIVWIWIFLAIKAFVMHALTERLSYSHGTPHALCLIKKLIA